jgi:hypothetical protein
MSAPQGSEAWKLERVGHVTASNVDAVLSRSRDRKSEGATRRNYKVRIISEILTRRPQEDSWSSKAMDDGLELEPLARSSYEIVTGTWVDEVGFIRHPIIQRSGASCDGLVGSHGVVEFKCPFPATHLDYRLEGGAPAKYLPQMQWEMACTSRKWADFVSYCPAFDDDLQLFIVRVPRNEAEIQRITAEINQFNREVDEIIEKLTGRSVDEYLAKLGIQPAPAFA